MAAPLRLADLLASVSLLSDLGFALPPEESMRSTIVATAIARRLNLDEATVADTFYTALIQHLGCTGFAHEVSSVYGNEMLFNAAVARVDTSDPRDVVNTLMRAVTRGRGPVDGVRSSWPPSSAGNDWGRPSPRLAARSTARPPAGSACRSPSDGPCINRPRAGTGAAASRA